MTKGELLSLIEKEGRRYSKEAINSMKINKHMHDCKNPKASQAFIDAILVDFINYIAYGQGVDYGLHTFHW